MYRKPLKIHNATRLALGAFRVCIFGHRYVTHGIFNRPSLTECARCCSSSVVVMLSLKRSGGRIACI